MNVIACKSCKVVISERIFSLLFASYLSRSTINLRGKGLITGSRGKTDSEAKSVPNPMDPYITLLLLSVQRGGDKTGLKGNSMQLNAIFVAPKLQPAAISLRF